MKCIDEITNSPMAAKPSKDPASRSNTDFGSGDNASVQASTPAAAGSLPVAPVTAAAGPVPVPYCGPVVVIDHDDEDDVAVRTADGIVQMGEASTV